MKRVECSCPRVKEVMELAELLEENGILPQGALRTAVECVYGLADRFYRHNYAHIDREAQSDEEWEGVKNY